MTEESWQRPAFEPGNQLAATHGAYSRAIAPKAQQILEEVTAAAPSWLRAVDSASLLAWAECEARCDVLRAWVAEHGMLDARGQSTSATDLLVRMERLAVTLRGRLGFDPLARAALGRDTAIAAAAAESAYESAAAVGKEIREARKVADDDDGA